MHIFIIYVGGSIKIIPKFVLVVFMGCRFLLLMRRENTAFQHQKTTQGREWGVQCPPVTNMLLGCLGLVFSTYIYSLHSKKWKWQERKRRDRKARQRERDRKKEDIPCVLVILGTTVGVLRGPPGTPITHWERCVVRRYPGHSKYTRHTITSRATG